MLSGKILMLRLTATVQAGPNEMADAVAEIRKMLEVLETQLAPRRHNLPAFTLAGGERIYEWWHDDTKNWRM